MGTYCIIFLGVIDRVVVESMKVGFAGDGTADCRFSSLRAVIAAPHRLSDTNTCRKGVIAHFNKAASAGRRDEIERC